MRVTLSNNDPRAEALSKLVEIQTILDDLGIPEMIKEAEKLKERLKKDMDKIREGGKEIIFSTDTVEAVMSVSERISFDQPKFKADHPDLFEAYQKPGEVRSFTAVKK